MQCLYRYKTMKKMKSLIFPISKLLINADVAEIAGARLSGESDVVMSCQRANVWTALPPRR